VATLTRVIADAVAEGLIARAGAAEADETPEPGALGADEPLADWERELLEGANAAAAAPPAAEVAPPAAEVAPEAEGAPEAEAAPAEAPPAPTTETE
jgi:small subunit ribosomal protein S2